MGANDPEHPGNLFARSEWRNGIFQHYKTLSLFYVGYGGNHNSTTRFRQYFAKAADTSDAIARPVIKEYTDKSHLLFPNKWYDIQIRVEKGITTYRINGEELFRLTIKTMKETDISDSAYWKITRYLQTFRSKSEEEITYNKSDSEVLFSPFYRVKVILPFKKIQN